MHLQVMILTSDCVRMRGRGINTTPALAIYRAMGGQRNKQPNGNVLRQPFKNTSPIDSDPKNSKKHTRSKHTGPHEKLSLTQVKNES